MSEEDEERSGFESGAGEPQRIVRYNPAIPIESFDLIITDVRLEALRRFYVSLSPKPEQARITELTEEHLTTAEELGSAVRMAQKGHATIRQSILKAAFEGRLVPQHPSDEPASALLARLRNSHPGNKARRRRARAAGDFPTRHCRA